MDLRHLRTLLAIAEFGSFAAAARAVGLTQSAVSLHIRALEEEFGTPLFDRSRRPPTPTPAGRALVAGARQIVDLCEEVRASIQGGELAGELELGAVPTILASLLPRALSDFQAAHPRVRIRVVSGLSAELAEMVRRGALDLAVVTGPRHPPEGLVWHEFLRERFVVVAPADLPGESDRELLESRPFIQFSRRTWAGEMIDRQLRRRRIRVAVGMEIDSLEAIRAMVLHGLGVSIVPLAPGAVAPAGLRLLPFGDPPLERPVGIVERDGNPKTRLVQALLRELRRLAAD